MTPARLFRLLAGLGLAALVGACSLMSRNPVGPEAAAVADPLLSAWGHESSDGEVIFLHVLPAGDGDGRQLTVLYAESPKAGGAGTWYALRGHVSAVEGAPRYLNLRLVASDPAALREIDEAHPGHADHPWSFVPYRFIDPDHLLVAGLPGGAVAEAIRQGRLAGRLGGDAGFEVAVLEDGPERIAAFLAAADAQALFADAVAFARVKAAP
ncbi:MAG: hypothetical protein IRY94_03250 [Rhodospirillaceae bacterium]|nr:hypothetical protein [Rhodospirillaceae bacterium]